MRRGFRSALLSLAILAAGEGSSISQDSDALTEEAMAIARAFLSRRNAIEGIAHIGGPFVLEDYTATTNREETGSVRVEFKYKSPNGIKGYPDDFSIYGRFTKTNEAGDPPVRDFPHYRPYKVTGNISPGDVQSILKSWLRTQRNSEFGQIELVTVRNATKLERQTRWRSKIAEIEATSPDQVVVRSGRPLFALTDGPSIHLEKRENSWSVILLSYRDKSLEETTPPKLSEQPLTPLPLTFEVPFGFGEHKHHLSDQDILQIVANVRRIEGLPNKIVELSQYESASVAVVTGELAPVETSEFQTFRKKDSVWSQIKEFNLYGGTTPIAIFSPQTLPLLPKPTAEQIQVVRKNCRVDTNISDQEVDTVVELVLRIRGFDKRLVSISGEKNLLTVQTGRKEGPLSGGGRFVNLKFMNGIWIITGFGM